MALDNIQNKYTEGEGSPEGVVKGKKGFTYKDTLTNDEYTSLGGDKWRIESFNNEEIISRELKTSTDVNKLDDLYVGEEIYIKDRKARFKLTTEKKKSYLTLKVNENGTFSNRLRSDIFFKNKVLQVGDQIEIEVYIQQEAIGSGRHYLLPHDDGYTGIQLTRSDNQYTAQSRYNLYSVKVYDESGIELANSNLEDKGWFKIVATVIDNPITVNRFLIGRNETSMRGSIIRIRALKINFNSAQEYYNFLPSSFDGTNLYEENLGIPFVSIGDFIDSPIEIPLKISQLSDNKDRILEVVPINGEVTPQMFGYKDNFDSLNFNNDAYPYIKECIDSNYNVLIPPGNYFVSQPIIIHKPKIIKMFGNNYPIGNEPNFETTYIYTNSNIHIINVESNNVHISEGVISLREVENLETFTGKNNRSCMRIDPRAKIETFSYKDGTLIGNKDALLKNIDCGGYGLYFAVNEDSYNDGPYFTGLEFKNIKIKYLNIGINIPKVSQAYASKIGWHNTVNFIDFYIGYCKIFTNFKSGSIYNISCLGQDGPVLLEQEKENYCFLFDSAFTYFDVFTYDRGKREHEPLNAFRHSINNIYSKHNTNFSRNKSSIGITDSRIKLGATNHRTIIRDPDQLVLSANNLISRHLNPSMHIGNKTGYSVKKFAAIENVDIYLPDSASSINNEVEDIGDWSNSGSASVIESTTTDTNNSNYALKIKSTNEYDEQFAKKEINVEIDKVYNISFDSRISSTDANALFKTTGFGSSNIWDISGNAVKTKTGKIVVSGDATIKQELIGLIEGSQYRLSLYSLGGSFSSLKVKLSQGGSYVIQSTGSRLNVVDFTAVAPIGGINEIIIEFSGVTTPTDINFVSIRNLANGEEIVRNSHFSDDVSQTMASTGFVKNKFKVRAEKTGIASLNFYSNSGSLISEQNTIANEAINVEFDSMELFTKYEFILKTSGQPDIKVIYQRKGAYETIHPTLNTLFNTASIGTVTVSAHSTKPAYTNFRINISPSTFSNVSEFIIKKITTDSDFIIIDNLEVVENHFENNLFESDSVLNNNTIISDSYSDNSNVIINDYDMFRGFDYPLLNRITSVNSNGYAEFILPYNDSFIRMEGKFIDIDKVQIVFLDSNKQPYYSNIVTDMANLEITPLIDKFNLQSKLTCPYVMLRIKTKPNMVGLLQDFIVLTKNNNDKPYISSLGGRIRLDTRTSNGSDVSWSKRFISEMGICDGHNLLNPNSIIEFDDNITNIEVWKKTPTIYLKNTSGLQKSIELEFGYKTNHMAGYQFTFKVLENSSPIKLNQTGNSKFFLTDKKRDVLYAGDWIRFAFYQNEQGIGGPGENYFYPYEIGRSTDSNMSLLPLNTENTYSTISLTTTGGNSCNMASANTNKTFTTTGDVLNAFAEVLVNRVDQPEITGATYKASKGVPFVASTDMIMRVENKGVPRGVVYWFEEV